MHSLIGEVAGRPVHVPLLPGRYRLGRGPRNEIDIDDRSVSREHAELIVDETRIVARDLGSSNGTWLNDRPLSVPSELQPGDRLRLGDQELRLVAVPSAPAPGAAAGAKGGPLAEPATVAGLHVPEVPLSDPDEIRADARLSWDTASQQRTEAPEVERALLRAVTEAGQLLVVPRPLDETFDAVLRIVARAIPARRILLLLTDTPDGSPAIRAAHPAAGGDEKLMLSRTIIGTVLRDREALLLNDAMRDPRFNVQESVILQKVRSAMVAPLFDNTQVIGLLYADSEDPRVHYGRDQLHAFTLLAHLIAVKITNARLLEADRERERMTQEIASAARVQRSLLPRQLPEIPGYEILARQAPCDQIAGDLYDVARLPDGRIVFVVGDVTGKGLPAALLMSNTMACLRVLYSEALPLVTLAQRVDRELLESSDEIYFVTLFVGLLDPHTHTLQYVNAGHNAPLLFCGGEQPRRLTATGMPLGLLPQARFSLGEITLPSDCLLCVFSDGIPEAQAGDEEYGDDRLIRSAVSRCGHPLEGIADGVIGDLHEFLGEHPVGDDVTLLLLRRQG